MSRNVIFNLAYLYAARQKSSICPPDGIQCITSLPVLMNNTSLLFTLILISRVYFYFVFMLIWMFALRDIRDIVISYNLR